jgi:hypothetical protein
VGKVFFLILVLQILILQNKFALPHIAPLPKGWGSIKRVPVVVFGLINFALKYRVVIPYLPVWLQTPNFTISSMYQHFLRVFETTNCLRAPELNKTFDGSLKEYKNVVYLTFAYFKVVIVPFNFIF